MFTIHSEENAPVGLMKPSAAEPQKKARRALGDISLNANNVNVQTPAGKITQNKPITVVKAVSTVKVKIEPYLDPKDMVCPGILIEDDPFTMAFDRSLKSKDNSFLVSDGVDPNKYNDFENIKCKKVLKYSDDYDELGQLGADQFENF